MTHSGPEWTCCQIGAREHYAVPRALHRRGALAQMVTDAWISPTSPLGAVRPGLRGRYHADLAGANICAPNLSSIAFELGAKASRLRRWPLMIARNSWFQKVAARRLSQIRPKGRRPTLMAYSYAALDLFKLARARGWRTVLGQIDPGPLEERIVAGLYNAQSLHRSDWEAAPPEYWMNWNQECLLADRIVVNSSWSYSALREVGVSASKIRIVPLAYEGSVATNKFRRQYPPKFTPDRPLRALFLGQVNLRKGIGPLFDVIRILQDEPIEFSFVGPVQIHVPPDIRNNPRVRWIGAVGRQETERYYRDADLLLFPTYSDGFGITQLEAQSWKLPVITSQFCGDVITNGKNGWLLEEISSSAIATSLRHCFQDPVGLQEASDRSGVDNAFSLARIGSEWLNIFED